MFTTGGRGVNLLPPDLVLLVSPSGYHIYHAHVINRMDRPLNRHCPGSEVIQNPNQDQIRPVVRPPSSFLLVNLVLAI